MKENQNRFDDDLATLRQEISEYEADSERKNEKITTLYREIDAHIERDYEDTEIHGLRERLLAAEVELVETHPRLAAALRSFVAIVDNAGL